MTVLSVAFYFTLKRGDFFYIIENTQNNIEARNPNIKTISNFQILNDRNEIPF